MRMCVHVCACVLRVYVCICERLRARLGVRVYLDARTCVYAHVCIAHAAAPSAELFGWLVSRC